jgi:hypothetical protein
MSERLTDAEVEAIRARAEAATPGPWRVRQRTSNGQPTCLEIYAGNDWIATLPGSTWLNLSDPELAAFIAAARVDVPRLCDTIAAQAARIAELEAELASFTTTFPPNVVIVPGTCAVNPPRKDGE